MGIEALSGKGVSRARVSCDVCGCAEVVPCDFERDHRKQIWLPNVGQISRKMVGQGWSDVKGRLHCRACEAKRKAATAKKEDVTVAEAKSSAGQIRQPSPEQEVDIIVALSSVYDRKAKRYQGAETDVTVAEVVGGGCMPGWVAVIRAAKFGPAGNEELAAIRAEITRLEIETGKALTTLTARLNALYRAEDKRVRS